MLPRASHSLSTQGTTVEKLAFFERVEVDTTECHSYIAKKSYVHFDFTFYIHFNPDDERTIPRAVIRGSIDATVFA
jgi:hypothetical protein